VHNRNYSESSIVEGYLAYECLTFFSSYLHDNILTKFNKLPMNVDGSMGDRVMTSLEPIEWEQVHRYVLFNCELTQSSVM